MKMVGIGAKKEAVEIDMGKVSALEKENAELKKKVSALEKEVKKNKEPDNKQGQ